MGTGTDVAMHSAGVTLVKGDLRGIVHAIALSRATMRNIRQNLLFAFLYNATRSPDRGGRSLSVFRRSAQSDLCERGDGLEQRVRHRQCAEIEKDAAYERIASTLLWWRLGRARTLQGGSARSPHAIAALLVSVALLVACSKAPEQERKVKMYQSPMHPWITSDKPGNCTICGMALGSRLRGRVGHGRSREGVVSLNPRSVDVLAVTTVPVRRLELTKSLPFQRHSRG